MMVKGINYKMSIRLSGLIITLLYLIGCGSPVKESKTTDTIPVTKSQLNKRPVVVELIIPKDSVFDPHALYDLAKGFVIDVNDINKWENRIVVYADIANPDDLFERIKSEYPQDTVKYFDKPFYNFNRKMCADTISSKKWDNILLSANLVNDSKLQQEYLNYHATQFQQWPEVSKGFCNANFQQLLVFKNGRQLMLVISIPKGENLDKLNPLTTKNNPRVDEWNKLMAKYQEGLPGTKPGEVWVFFKPLEYKTE